MGSSEDAKRLATATVVLSAVGFLLIAVVLLKLAFFSAC